MKKIDILKKVVTVIATVGVGAVVGNAVKATTPADLKIQQKIIVGIGAFVIGGMVSEQATKHTEQQFDEIVQNVKETTNSVNEAVQEQKEK